MGKVKASDKYRIVVTDFHELMDNDQAAQIKAIKAAEAIKQKPEPQLLGAPRAVQLLHFAADLFAHKNAGYNRQGTTSRYRGFSNFYEARAVRKGMLTPAQYAMTLCDKQDDAAWNALYEGPMSEAKWKDLPERLMDGIVYRAITLALLELDAWDKWKKRQEESLPTKKRDRNKK